MRKQTEEPEYSSQADKYLKKIDKNSEERIREGIEKIPEGNIIKYKGKNGYFRLKIGKYRVLFTWMNDDQVLIAMIDSRGQVYKKGV